VKVAQFLTKYDYIYFYVNVPKKRCSSGSVKVFGLVSEGFGSGSPSKNGTNAGHGI